MCTCWTLLLTVRGRLEICIWAQKKIIGCYERLFHPPLQTKCIQNNAGGGQVVKCDRKQRALWEIWYSF